MLIMLPINFFDKNMVKCLSICGNKYHTPFLWAKPLLTLLLLVYFLELFSPVVCSHTMLIMFSINFWSEATIEPLIITILKFIWEQIIYNVFNSLLRNPPEREWGILNEKMLFEVWTQPGSFIRQAVLLTLLSKWI